MAGREVLMHITNTPPNRRRSCHKLASPDLNTSLDKVTPMLTEEHDTQAERRERRKSRILELQRQQLQETTSPNSPAARRSSAPLNGLTTGELKDHYANCLKLSTENKITSKNAFGLHLIDYFADLVKKKQIENFQEASSTLDASAKIYAGRVDFIHNETLKVLSGLGRSSDKQGKGDDNAEPGGADNAEAEEGADAAKKKRRTRKSYTIETNLKNINVNKFDLEFEVDPMFKVMSAAFDEGGASGLLLNNLRCYDNNQLLVLDSTTAVSVTEDRGDEASEPVSTQYKPVETGVISEFLSKNRLEEYHICPPFREFTFTNWDMSDRSIVPPKAVSEHAFDMDAEPEPVVMGDGDYGTFMEDLGDAALDDDSTSTVSEVSNPVGDTRSAILVKSAFAELSSGMTGTLAKILASKPSEYSFFDKAVLQSWAGPAHWRIRPLSKDVRVSGADKPQRSKTKKPAFRLDFEKEAELEAKSKQSKATRLTKHTLETQWNKEKTTLPEDLHYTTEKHFKLFSRPAVMVQTQDTGSVNVDDGVETYNYDNTNDRENFVPGEGVPDNDDDDDVEDFGFSGYGIAGEGSSASLFSQNSMLGNTSALNATTLTGDKLVAQPFKVAKIDISYAKTAKRIDVRKVKQAMWGILTSKPPEATPSDPGPTGEGKMATPEPPKDRMESSWRMQEMLTELPKRVSLQTARNLSVPIAFVCLLHLANEKVLRIENIGMEDLQIHQEQVA